MDTILTSIGNTPLIRLKRSLPPNSANVFAKLEKFNPGGSLKDRIVLHILNQAEAQGLLKPGGTVVAGTTGNSGISLASIGNIKKYRVVLTMPENFSLERRKILQLYGATLHLTPAAEGMKGAIARAEEMAKETGAFLFQQFANPETARAHELTTAVEILKDLSEPIHAFVAGVGTGGTLIGVGRVLKSRGARLIAVEPEASPLLSQGKAGPHKIQGIGPGFVPTILHPSLDPRYKPQSGVEGEAPSASPMEGATQAPLIDEIVTVSDQAAYEGAQEIAQQEGILAGISCGAAFVAARRVAQSLGAGKNVVTIFPDGGERYFSMKKYFRTQ